MQEVEIEDLIVMDLYGIISSEDKNRLEAILLSDGNARELQKKLRATVTLSDIQSFNDSKPKDIEEAVQQLRMGYEYRQKRKRNRHRQLGFAAAILILLTAIYLLPRERNNMPVLAVLSDKNIVLQTADGKQTILKDGKQIIKTGNASFYNNGNVLTQEITGRSTTSFNTFSTPVAGKHTIKLSDGTEVTLNSRSVLCFPSGFTGKNREVFLEGEAYFNVAPGQHPFIVHAGHKTINVLGTTFNVNAYEPEQSVTASLLSGRIAIISAKERVDLSPGQTAISSTGTSINIISTTDSSDIVSWMNGIKTFDDGTIEEIKTVIYNWFGQTIHIDDDAVKTAKLKITIDRKRGINAFINNMNATNEVGIGYKNGQLHCWSTLKTAGKI